MFTLERDSSPPWQLVLTAKQEAELPLGERRVAEFPFPSKWRRRVTDTEHCS